MYNRIGPDSIVTISRHFIRPFGECKLWRKNTGYTGLDPIFNSFVKLYIMFLLFCFVFLSLLFQAWLLNVAAFVRSEYVCGEWELKKKKNILDIVFELSRIIMLESILLKIIMRVINNKCNIIFSRLFRIYILRFVRFCEHWVEIIISDRSQRGGKIFSKLLLPFSSNIRILKIYPAPLFSHLEIKVFLQVQLAHHLPLYYDFYHQRIRKKGIKFRMNLQVGDPDPDFTFLHVPPRDSRDGISYNDATREEDWNCLPKIFSFFFSLSLNKFAIKMFHPTIRKKGRRKIWNSKHYTSSIFQIFYLFSLIPRLQDPS